jgi:hypothetical protein
VCTGFADLAIYRHFGDFPLGFGSKILNLRLAIKWAIFNKIKGDLFANGYQ